MGAPSDFQELDDMNADGDVESRPSSRRASQKDYTIERKLSENLVKKHLRTMLSETLATFILVFLGATVVSQFRYSDFSFVAVGLAHGYGLWTAITIFGHYSAICNPSVSFTLMFLPQRWKNVGWQQAFISMLAEVAGQMLGSVLAGWCTWTLERNLEDVGYGNAGVPYLAPHVSEFQGWLFEFLGSAILMWVILVAVFDGPIIKTVKTPSYSIGMALGVLVLVGGNISGSSLNFARYFGPALFGDGVGPQSGLSSQWWIYFTGPLFGDAFAALLWYFVFRKGNHLLETELLSQ